MYDVAIIGGGLGGLIAALELSDRYKVLLLEKEQYPFHKVCGEYISNESKKILEKYGLSLTDWQLPQIKRLKLSASSGHYLETELDFGGFGISRYKLDAFLAQKALEKGVDLKTGCRVEDWSYHEGCFKIQTQEHEFQSRVLFSAHGKRSNLDARKQRSFFKKRTPYVGVKYHVVNETIPADIIALHNFNGGYLGCSRIESGHSCICYLIMQKQLNHYESIADFEERVLKRNPHIKEILENSKHLYPKPLVISQISFEKKEQVLEHALMLGDAAGMISPLSGNGMSMAMHSGYIASQLAAQFLAGRIGREEMERRYIREWKKEFSNRVWVGKVLQRSFGLSWSSSLFVRLIAPFKPLQQYLLRLTHGSSFG